MKTLSILITTILLLTSCTHLMNRRLREERCNATYAGNLGRANARNLDVNRTGLQESMVCTEENYPAFSFETDYEAGFRGYQNSFCSTKGMQNLASETANSLTQIVDHEPKLELCKEISSDADELSAAFNAQFKKSLCTTSQMARIAASDATNFSAQQTDAINNLSNLCGKRDVHNLQHAYTSAYDQQMRVQCNVTNAFQVGSKDASNKAAIENGIARFSKCPTELQAGAVQGYSQGFQTTQARLMEEERIRQQQEFQREQLRQQQRLLDQQNAQLRNQNNGTATLYDREGNQYSVSCTVENSYANVKVFYHGRGVKSLNVKWNIRFFDRNMFPVRDDTSYQYLSLVSGYAEKFKSYAPWNASYCSASF